MKAEELRIGNLIKSIHRPDEVLFKTGIVHSVEELRSGTIYVSDKELGTCRIRKHHVEPIPITEEWLLRFGFTLEQTHYTGEPVGSGDVFRYKLSVGEFSLVYERQTAFINKDYHQGHVYFKLEGNGGRDESGELDLFKITEYVHQLQNLFFSLTGGDIELSKEASDGS